MSGGGKVGIPGPMVYPPNQCGHLVAATKTRAVGKRAVRNLLECFPVYKRFTLLKMLNLLNCQPCHTFCKQFCFAVKKVYIKQKQNYTVTLM